MNESETYPEDERSKVHRLGNRGKYDCGTVNSIFNQASFVHVSFLPTDPSIDPFPTILPMLGSMGNFEEPLADPLTQPLQLYIHGHSSSRLMKLPGSERLLDDHPNGLPVCVAATLLDGLKLAYSPFNHSCNYRSAVVHGFAQLVTEENEKKWALRLMTNDLIPNRYDNARTPLTGAELQATSVLRVNIVSASAKISAGAVGDSQNDLDDDEVTSRVWNGILPVWECVGAPIESEKNKVTPVPEYLSSWIQGRNAAREEYALRVSSGK